MKEHKYNVAPLVRARELKRMSRAQLAAKIDRTENMVWKIEHGTSTSERTIFAMSRALDVPISELYINGNSSTAGRKRAS